MSDTRTQETMSEAFDEMHDSPLVETDFGRLAEKVLSRRGFLSGGAALAASAFVMSTGVLRPLSVTAFGEVPAPIFEQLQRRSATLGLDKNRR